MISHHRFAATPVTLKNPSARLGLGEFAPLGRWSPLLAALLLATPALPALALKPAKAAKALAGSHAASAPASAANPADSDLPPMPSTRSRAPVTLNFVNADVDVVSRAIGAMLDRQILVDPRVRGQMTITSDKPQPLHEAWRSYLSALRGMGFTVVENAGWLKVVPEAEGKLQAGTVQIGPPVARGDQVLTQIFRLNHENPNNLVAVLRPLISANNTINANPGNGTLIITDYADNLQRLAKIISALDQPAASEVEVVPVRHAMASDLAPLVQKLVDTSASPVGGAPGGSQTTATSILVEPRSNALIIRTANPARMAAAKTLIDKLDRPIPGGGPAGNIWVVYLKNSDAVKLAEVLRAAMASGAASASGSGNNAGSSSSGARPAVNPVNNTQQQPGGAGSTAATTPVAASAGPSTGGQIQADPSTNALIISASEPVYRQMRQVIDQLDTRRVQIRVESIIVKVDASKSADFGVQWQGLLGGTNGNNTALYSGTNFGSGGNNLLNLSVAAATSSSSTTSSLPGTGLNVGVLQKIAGTWTLGALAHFLEGNAGGNVLSTPEIVALDNEEAKIVVGQNVPFITGSYTNSGGTTGSANPFQTIERKDVGLTLRIKSQVGEGGTVRMTIYQENSAVSQSTTSGLITDKSSIETTVLIDDGATLVLGGLMKDEYTDTESGVPILSQIPYLGNLFKSTSRSRSKSNLMVFLRPTVLRDQVSADRITVNRYESMRALQSATQPPTDNPLLPMDGAAQLPSLNKAQPAGAAAANTAASTAASATPAAK